MSGAEKTFYHDKLCRLCTMGDSNLLVSWYLMAGYAYYIHDESILSDGLFDDLAKAIKRNWHRITHRHKNLIKQADLDAGTLFQLTDEDYPEIVKGAAMSLVQKSADEAMQDHRFRQFGKQVLAAADALKITPPANPVEYLEKAREDMRNSIDMLKLIGAFPGASNALVNATARLFAFWETCQPSEG